MGRIAPPGALGTDVSTDQGVHGAALRRLVEADLPFAVGGYFALHHHTGISRPIKDLDLFLPPSHVPAALQLLREVGFKTRVLARHWLAKATWRDQWVDLIFGFGNWLAPIDELWIERGPQIELYGVPAGSAPVPARSVPPGR